MGDAVDVTALPEGLDLYLTYVDGAQTSGHTAAMVNRFGPAIIPKLVYCTVTGASLSAQVGDVERFDMTPAEGGDWARRKLDAGRVPTVYCSASSWHSQYGFVGDSCGPRTGEVQWLIADYDDQPVIPPGAIGHQYQSTTYDRSVVADFWPGVDDQEDEMGQVTLWGDGTRLAVYSAHAGMRHLTPWEARALRTNPQLRAQVANPDQPWQIDPGDLDNALAWKDRTK